MLYPLHQDNWPSHWLYWLLFTCLYFANAIRGANAAGARERDEMKQQPFMIAATQMYPVTLNGIPLTVNKPNKKKEHLFSVRTMQMWTNTDLPQFVTVRNLKVYALVLMMV